MDPGHCASTGVSGICTCRLGVFTRASDRQRCLSHEPVQRDCDNVCAWCVFRIVVDQTNVPIAGVIAGLMFACGTAVWTRATRAEVHAVETALVSLALLFLLRWFRSGVRRDLVIAASVYGCAIAVHPAAMLAAPGGIVLVLARLPETDVRHLRDACALAVACTLAWFVYLPLRSAFISRHGLDPVAALGMPGTAFWDYAHPSTPEGFIALIGARDVTCMAHSRSHPS